MAGTLRLGVAEFVLMLKDEMSKDAATALDTVDTKAATTGRGFEVAAVAATALGGAIVGAMGVSVKAFMEGERATAQLDAVLKSTNGAAGMTRDGLLELADSLQKVSTYDDEAIIGAESLLLTFTKVGKEVFPEAIGTILDMSTALGKDLSESSIIVGKALNDPIKGITALGESGVSFTADQKEMIKSMVEAGDVMGAQKLILAELATEFGGSAAAAAETFSGRLDQINVSLGNLFEAIGGALMGGEGASGKDFLLWIRDTVDAAKEWVDANPALASGIVQTTAAVGGLLLVLGPLVASAKLISTVVMAAASAIGWLGTAAGVAAGGGGSATLAAAGAGGAAVSGGTGGIAGLTAALSASLIPLGSAAIAAGVLGYATYKLTEYLIGTKDATEELKQSQMALQETEERYIQTLKEKGVTIDENRMKTLNDAQQRAYLALQETEERDTLTRAWLQYYLERVEGETDFAQAKNLMLNQTIDAEEAAFLVSQHLSADKVQFIMKASEEETQAVLDSLGYQKNANAETQASISSLAASGAAERQKIFIENSVAIIKSEKETVEITRGLWWDFFEVFRDWTAWANSLIGDLFGSVPSPALPMLPPGGAPQMATGGIISRGGMVRVHRDEDIILPSFAEVIPKQHTSAVRAAIEGGGGSGVHIQFSGPVTFSSDMDVERVGRSLGRSVRREMASRGIG